MPGNNDRFMMIADTVHRFGQILPGFRIGNGLRHGISFFVQKYVQIRAPSREDEPKNRPSLHRLTHVQSPLPSGRAFLQSSKTFLSCHPGHKVSSGPLHGHGATMPLTGTGTTSRGLASSHAKPTSRPRNPRNTPQQDLPASWGGIPPHPQCRGPFPRAEVSRCPVR